MNPRRAGPLAGVLLLLVIPACNFPSSTPPNPMEAAATIVALTLQAQGLPTSSGIAPATATPNPSPTPAPPILYIQSEAKCRSGPGPNFKIITTFAPGLTLEMIGRDSAHGYWVVRVPNSAETCWVQAQDASPGGDFESLPEVTPAVSQQRVPSRPGALFYDFFCDNNSLTTTLKWTDTADNENGYRVYRQGSPIADLPPNSTSYTDTFGYILGTQVTYAVEAYNDAGVSPQRAITFTCPP